MVRDVVGWISRGVLEFYCGGEPVVTITRDFRVGCTERPSVQISQ